MTIPLLNEAAVTGTSFDRAKSIHIDNNVDGTVAVSYFEETLIALADGTTATRPTGRSPIRTVVDLNRTVTLVTGPNVGQKFKVSELQAMIASLYFEDHAAEIAKIKATAALEAQLKANFQTSLPK